MNISQIKAKILSPEYDFLRANEHNIILLALGGSHAYGTDNEDSDIDLRGCALRSKYEILTGQNFEQVNEQNTDTTIYAFDKLVSLLTNCNPNVIELLGLKPEHYLYIHPIGQELLNNKKLFLSQKAVNSFGDYAKSQLRRLDNKAVRLVGQKEREQHIFNSIQSASHDFPDKYFSYKEDSIELYIDTAINPKMETEVFMNVNLQHYPLRDYKAMWSEMNNIVKDYAKIGKRNKHAIEHDKLGKHMCHLVRLYLMCFDILEHGEIITYREKEHDLLVDIRNGKYLDSNKQPIPEFFEMVNTLETHLDYARKNTDLPEQPDYDAINDFVASVNERIVRDEI